MDDAPANFTLPEPDTGHCWQALCNVFGDELTYSLFARIFKETTGGPLRTTWMIFGVGLMAMVKDIVYMFKCSIMKDTGRM